MDPQGSMATLKGPRQRKVITEIHDSGSQHTLLISILLLLQSQSINVLT